MKVRRFLDAVTRVITNGEADIVGAYIEGDFLILTIKQGLFCFEKPIRVMDSSE